LLTKGLAMTLLDELRLYSDALAAAIANDRKFFAPIVHYVKQLQSLSRARSGEVSQSALHANAVRIDAFFEEWRPSKDPLPGTLYIPPQQISGSDPTVCDIMRVVSAMQKIDEKEFRQLFPSTRKAAEHSSKNEAHSPCVFIGHGRSKLWARLKTFLEDELNLATTAYESRSRVGEQIVDVLNEMLNKADFAILILTAEDETKEGKARARQNVVHEVGLFQGRLGFKRVVMLRQDGLEDFTNVHGIQYIPFPKDNIEQTFYELQRVIKREGLLPDLRTGSGR